jgi:multiple sugar transport system permease protein
VVLFVMIIVLIGSMQIFDDPQILTEGGPANASISVVQYLYSRGIDRLEYGYAAAVGVFLFAVIFVLSLLQFRVLRGFRSDA